MQNPCYDVATKTDCPNRKEGCAIGCEKWAAYVKERDEFYDKRIAENAVNSVEIRQASIRATEQAKRYMNHNRRYRTKWG